MAERLAHVLRFQRFRCFHYRDENGAARLESGEDIASGLAIQVNNADIVVYLIEENFSKSPYCQEELRQGVKVREEGQLELRLYKLNAFKNTCKILNTVNVYEFHDIDWGDPKVEEQIVKDVEQSATTIGWALREQDREVLFKWLKEDGIDSPQRIAELLCQWNLPEAELREIEIIGITEFPIALLRLPTDDDRKRRRNRRIVALLLLSLSSRNEERSRVVNGWIYERRLIQRPPALTAPPEDLLEVDIGPIVINSGELTKENVVQVGKSVGQKIYQSFSKEPAMDTTKATALCIEAQKEFLAMPIEWACESQDDEPFATRRPVRWRLKNAETRQTIFEGLKENALPPATLFLALNSPEINPLAQVRQLQELVRTQYEALGWPPELVTQQICNGVEDALAVLEGCQRQVVHVAGHMGSDGFQVGDKILEATHLVNALQQSEVRLIVLNGCSGAGIFSSVAVEYLSLSERLIRDAKVPEVVAHRIEISEDDALAFAREFHIAFFNASDGFEPATATLRARKVGSKALRYSPVAISQRRITQ